MTDLLIVGAGPAGRALAHRCLLRGLSVTMVDPHPERPWTATIGAFADDLPGWLTDDVIACGATSFVVYTPQRRVVDRGYCVLSATGLQAALTLDGAQLERHRVEELNERHVRTDDGRTLTARHVIDARGGWSMDPAIARQRAFGSVQRVDDAERGEMVLMDWRCTPHDAPSFNYRVDLGDGTRLVEETCLAGRPAVRIAELRRRTEARFPDPGLRAPEEVDFPLYLDPVPWRRRGPLRFGAAGGLMHPATGYSIAASLATADGLAAAIADGTDPRAYLWPPGARWNHRLRMIGLAVLLGFGGRDLVRFFDTFFALPLATQRAYLGERTSARGIAGAMWAVFTGLRWAQRARLIAGTTTAAGRLIAAELAATAGPVIRRWPCRRRDPSPGPGVNRGPAAGAHRPR